MGIDDDIARFEDSVDKASKKLETGEVTYPAQVQAILSAAIMVTKAIMILARTNRVKRP